MSIETILHALETASARNDTEATLALFAADASIESPLVARVFNRKEGIARGHAEIRQLLGAFEKRGRPWGGHEPPIVRGNIAAIEYRDPSDREKFSVDIIEVRDGLIQSLRAYVGWRALASLGER
jgi:ketosteroid isomerase-like protein